MEKQAREKIVIIGCGNVAWHITKQLVSLKKFRISIYNHRKNPSLSAFKTKLKCSTEVGLDAVIPDASVYFICVTDKSIRSVAEKLVIKNPNAILVHTSGSAKLEELGNRAHSTGVLYPLQSFSKGNDINWAKVPILIESDKDSLQSVSELAGLFSKTVVSLNYKSRLRFHLAAVLVNNFTNAMYVSAFDLIKLNASTRNAGFGLLLPLIEQTTAKLGTMDPREAQTGPAKRKDETVMKKHLDLISDHSDLKKIYKQLSKLIVKQQEGSNA